MYMYVCAVGTNQAGFIE